MRGRIKLPEVREPNPELVVWTGGSVRLALLLQGRGIGSREEVDELLNPLGRPQPDLSEYPPLVAALARVETALENKEKIAVYGDYDVDGITATAVLVTALTRLGAQVAWHIPDRFREGYGLHEERIRALAQAGVGLIVTCDCGISNHREIALAKSLGVDVLVTDHHTPPPELPPACCILNFKLLPPDHPSRDLPGVGTAFVLARALLAAHGEESEDLLDLVALGIIADVVPLRGHNRQLYAQGLPLLRSAGRPGLAALYAVAGLAPELVDEEKLAFQIAPRINASGRIGDGAVALRLLLTQEREEATALARELDQLNSLRKELGRKILEELNPQPGRALVAYGPEWHQGVIGIVAGQICSGNGAPAILMTKSRGEAIVGSARSVQGIDIYQVLSQCAGYLDKFGGHPAAAGFSLQPDNLEQFSAALQEALDAAMAGWIPPPLEVDLVVEAREVDLQLAEELNRLSPCGEGNPRPLLFCSGLALKSQRPAGSGYILTLGDRRHSFTAGLWHQPAPDPGAGIGAVFTISEDYYRGQRSVWATLEAWWPKGERIEVRARGPQYLDRRGAPWQRILREFPGAAVYREGVRWQDYPGNTRNNLPANPTLVLLTPPPSANLLRHLLAMAEPELVVLAFSRPQGEFMADFLGALKYILGRQGGTVLLPVLAAALGQREETVLAGLRLLSHSGVVDYQLVRGRLILQKREGTKLKAGPGRQELQAQVDETKAFQNWLAKAPVREIQRIQA
ncbi:MAG: single-stranded-DNA-specific exonuclease RecJ [Bacillota bacterium]